ncbi:helix-turn-helix domain-containing protein [Streptomyces sp. NPDC020472]|uniref:helix-turn-helix domain-containing protein n=1 Tax=Streptomyces sp. NPDC020472 TaxID=3365075 RepID=UPI0037929AB7
MTRDESGESTETAPADRIQSASVLGEESRRRMFAFIRRAGHPVSRDEAAASVGISRKLAAFHLDKLVDAGLLRARYGTPGAVRRVGRQTKVYEPADAQITVSIPERRHQLLADLLLEAVLAQSAGECCVRLRPAPDGPSRDRAGADGRPPRRDS